MKHNFRWILAFMFFIIGLIAYMDRANIAVVAKDLMKEFNIDLVEFGLLSSIFSLGYALAQIPSGALIQRFGNKIMLIFALIFWSLFTILTPIVATFFALCVVRFLFGVGEAPMYPANASFNNYWFSKKEKARAASFILAGSYFGPVVAPFVSVYIITSYGWHSVFYIFGVLGLIVAAFYFFISSSKPEQNKFISSKELEYIKNERFISTSTKIPWRNFMKNREFWALGLAYGFIGYMPGMFMTWLPLFLLQNKGLELKSLGFWAGLPWMLICIFVFAGGAISDKLLAKFNSFKIARTYLAIFGFVCFILFIYLGMHIQEKYLSIVFLSLAFGFFGLPVCISWAVAADKGRDKAAVISSWMNVWGNIGSALSPLIVGYIAKCYGWDLAILSSIIPVVLAIIAYLFVKPDNALN